MSVINVRSLAGGEGPEGFGHEWARPDESRGWSAIFGPADLSVFVSRFIELNRGL